jgi:AcrR family transcriptional regulator
MTLLTLDRPLERRRRKDARPAELVEAALAEFALYGFAATRLEDVARRAGVVKGTIYRYFADKEALFMAVVQSRLRPMVGEIDGFVDSYTGDTRSLLHMMLRMIYAQLVESDLRVMMRIVLGESSNFPQLAAMYHAEMISQGKCTLDRVIARGVARGEVRPGPIADMPMVIVGPAIMATVWKMTFDQFEPLDIDNVIAAHLDLLDHGLFVRP